MSIKNIAPATPGVLLIPVHLSGQFTTSVTAAARIKIPFKAKLLGVSVAARASGGTSPTLAADVKADGSTMLTAPVDVTAGQSKNGVIAADDQLADEEDITIDLDIGGTSPTWDDIDVVLTVFRN